MEIVFDIERQKEVTPKVVTVGFFDGVHLGHRFLIGEMQRIAREKGLKTAIVTFDEHPRKVLQSDYCPQLITTKEEKIEEFERLGVDYCYFLHFTPDMASMPAKNFMNELLKKAIGASVLLVGYDHRFGKGRGESLDEYVKYGEELGVEVLAVPPFLESDEASSSSVVRRLILDGKMEKATTLLTRPYKIAGTVVSGFGVGREIGFPTANLQISADKILPPDGVYAVTVRVEQKPQAYAGMLYVGTRPTLNNGENKSVEVNIFDFNETIYNCKVTVEFIKRIRGDIRFNSVPALKEQLGKDKSEVLKILSRKS